MSIDWRASLVPAAAVIPAPIAYIKVAVVKLLVVVFLCGSVGPPMGCASVGTCIQVNMLPVFMCSSRVQIVYFEEIEVLRACICIARDSME